MKASTKPAKATAKLAAIYVRVSTDKQTQATGGGISYEAQLDAAREYAARNGFAIAEEVREIESASKPGKLRIVADDKIEIDATRKGFTRLVGKLLAKDCPIRTLIVSTMDRV